MRTKGLGRTAGHCACRVAHRSYALCAARTSALLRPRTRSWLSDWRLMCRWFVNVRWLLGIGVVRM